MLWFDWFCHGDWMTMINSNSGGVDDSDDGDDVYDDDDENDNRQVMGNFTLP